MNNAEETSVIGLSTESLNAEAKKTIKTKNMNTSSIYTTPQGVHYTHSNITKARSKVVGGIDIALKRITILLLLMFVMGMNVAWGDTTIGNYQLTAASEGTTLYEKALSGEKAWASTDITTTSGTVGSWYSTTFTTDATHGLYQAAAEGSRSAVLTCNHTDNTKQTIDLVFDNLVNTGNASNYSYIKLGSAIEIQSNQQNQTGTVIINGVSYSITDCNQKNYNRGGDKWTIHAEINTGTNKVTALTIVGTDGTYGSTSKHASFALSESVSLGSAATFNTVTVGTNRAAGSPAVALNSIKIVEATQDGKFVSYTINYKYNNATVLTTQGKTKVGETITAESHITVDNQKYYVADNSEKSITIIDGTNVLDVTLRLANVYTYSYKSSLGTTLVEGNVTEGESTTVYWSKYINHDDKWYVADDATFGATISNASQNVSETRNYSEDNTGIVKFFETEGMTKSANPAATLTGTGYSGGVTSRHAAGSYWYTEALSAGTYNLYVPYVNQNSTDGTLYIYYRDAAGELHDTGKSFTCTKQTTAATSVSGIEIPDGCSLVIYNTNTQYNSNVYIDYILLRKVVSCTLNYNYTNADGSKASESEVLGTFKSNTIYWNKYRKYNDKWYETSSPYGIYISSFEDVTQNISYTECPGIYVAWEESDMTLSSTYTGHYGTDASKGFAAGIQENATITSASKVPAGRYTMYINAMNRKAGADTYTFSTSTDGETYTDPLQTLIIPSGDNYVSMAFTLDNEAYIRLTETSGGNSYHYIDYVLLKNGAPSVTFDETALTTFAARKQGYPFTVDASWHTGHTIYMKIDGGEQQTYDAANTYHALNNVEIWFDDSEHETYYVSDAKAFDPTKKWAAFCYKEGFTDSNVPYDATQATVLLNALKENYNVVTIDISDFPTTNVLTDNLVAKAKDIASTDLVVVSEAVNSRTQEGQNGSFVQYVMPTYILNKTNVLNMKLFVYPRETWKWIAADKGVDNFTSSDQLSITPKNRYAKIFDGVDFNADGSITLFTERKALNHLHGYPTSTGLDGAGGQLAQKPDGTNGTTVMQPLATALDGSIEKTVMDYYKYTDSGDATKSYQYVGFGISIDDYPHYSANLGTIIANVGKAMANGEDITTEITSLDDPVITDNGDGRAKITSTCKSATVYYSTDESKITAIKNGTSGATTAEGVYTTKNNLTRKLNSTGEVTVYAVAVLAKTTPIYSAMVSGKVQTTTSRTITRTVSNSETDVTGTEVTMTYTAGATTTIPYNQTYKKEGYTVTSWIDTNTGTTYNPGTSITVDQDLNLQAVFTANAHKVTDLKEESETQRTAKFCFLHKDGAAWMSGVSGIMVGQVHFSDGTFIDIPCEYSLVGGNSPVDNSTQPGKFNNTFTNSSTAHAGTEILEYAQVKIGTLFQFPAVYGMTVNYKAEDLVWTSNQSILRTYVTYSTLKDGKITNPAFDTTTCPTTPTVPSGTNDNYATGGIYSYTGNDETAQFTSLDPSTVIVANTPSEITAGKTGGWQEASAFMNSLSVTYPSLYKIESVDLENATNNDDTDLNKAGSLTRTDAPGNTNGKYPKDMEVKIEVTPSYPYYFSKIENLNFPQVDGNDTVKVHYNYTTDHSPSQAAPTGTFYYSDIVSKNIYGGSYSFKVSKDMGNIVASIQRLTTYTINTDASPFRSGVVTLPDDRTAFAANNIITLTAKPKMGYRHVAGPDGWQNDEGQSLTTSDDAVRAMKNDTLSLFVTETSAKETYVAKFTSLGTLKGTLTVDLRDVSHGGTVPDGTITEGFPTSETNTTIAIPTCYTLYKEGYTLDHWQLTSPEALKDKKYYKGDCVPFVTYNEATAQPYFTANRTKFDYRTTTADITWDFRTAYGAQPMTYTNNQTVYYSTHADINNPVDSVDVPLVINTGAKGQIDNSNVDDWCLIGEGTSIVIPSGKGATFTLATYSPITSTNIDGIVLTDSTSTMESGQKVYLYSYTTPSTATTVTLNIGDDYSYYKYIRAQLPAADKVALNMSVNDQTMGSVTLASAKTEKSGGTDAATTQTSNGYTLPLGTWVTLSANRNNLYEFDHWEVNDETVDNGDVYTINTTDAGSVAVGEVNSTIQFQITSYETSVKAVFKARAQYQVKFLTGSADGIAPSAIQVEQGKTFDMPKNNQTLFMEGQTLKYWTATDGTRYDFGAKGLEINSDLTLTPVFEADEFTLVDIDSEKGDATATWNLTQTGDNKAPDLSYSGSIGIYVTQLTYQGKSIDIKLDLNSPGSTSSISNTADPSYCAIKSGAIISVPTTPGCEIKLSVKAGNDDEISRTTIAGAVGLWDKGTATSTATYDGEQGTQDIDFMGDVEAFTTISVTYKPVPSSFAMPSITKVRYGDEQMSDANLATLVGTHTVSGVTISPTSNDELPVISASCSNEGKATVTQPTSMINPKASIVVRSAGGILIGTYTVNFTVDAPTDAPVLTAITVNGVEATQNGDVWTVAGKQPVTGVFSLTFNRKMAEYSNTLTMGSISKKLHADAGKTLVIEYYDMPTGVTLPVPMLKSHFEDVYGNKCSTDESAKYIVNVMMADTKLSVKKRMIDFVVTKNYSSEYSHKTGGALPSTTNVLDDATITRLTNKGIHVGTIDEAITNANDVPNGINNAGATDNNRYYVFVPDGSYQMTGNSDLAITQEFIDESAANNSDGTKASLTVGTSFKNGRSYLNRNKGMVSIIGQSQDKTILWNKPYFYGISYTSTIEIRGIEDCYLQDLTLSNRFSDYQVADGSNPWGEAVAFYDRGERTIMKNVYVQGYKDTYVSDVTVTADKRGRNYYEGCNFAGTTDFIRGDGDIWWQGCKILLRQCRVDAEKGIGVITCPRTSTDNKYGYVFSNDTIDAYDDYGLALSGEYFLGRPWNNQPMVSYLNTTMKILPSAVGWAPYTHNLVLQMREYNSKDGSGNTVPLSTRSIAELYPASGSLDPVMLSADAATYTMANVLGGGEAYEPSLYTAQRPKVSDIDFNDNVLSWTDDAEALCYFIFRSETEKGDYKLYDITTSNSYTFEGDFNGWFIVRAANLRGGLGVPTAPLEYKNVERYTLEMTNALYTCGDDDDDYKGKSVTWSTICLPFNAKVPTVDADGDGKNDITVYAAKSIKDNTITLKKVNYITAKEGYVVYGCPGSYIFRSSSHTSEEADNVTTRLNGNPSTVTPLNATYYNCYTLAYKPNISGIGFYKFTGKTLACNKAWLDVDTFTKYNESSDDEETLQNNAVKKGIRFVFEDRAEDIPNDIKEISATRKVADDVIYDLNGTRVISPVKGRIYIVNGKKKLF